MKQGRRANQIGELCLVQHLTVRRRHGGDDAKSQFAILLFLRFVVF